MKETRELPGGYVLAEDERVLADEEFMPSLALFWLKSRVVITNRSILAGNPNTILKILPVGRQTQNIGLAHITNVESDREFSLSKLVFGTGFVLVGMFAGSWAATLMILLGIWIISAVFQTTLTLSYVGGPAEIKASFIQRERLETFHNQISRAIADARS